MSAGLLLMVGSIAAWLVSRTAGLPFPENGHQEPVGFKDGVTVLFELGSIPALLLLLSRELDRVSLPSPRLASQTMNAVGAVCCAMLVPALLLGGGEHHSHDEAVALGLHAEGESHGDAGGHELAQAGSGPAHERAAHDASGRERGGHGHRGSSESSGDGGHAEHTPAAAPLGSGHEHTGQPDGGTPRHHAGGDTEHTKRRGRDHGGHKKGGGRGDEHRGGGHGDEHGEGDGGQADKPPVSVSYDPLGVCLSGVCVP